LYKDRTINSPEDAKRILRLLFQKDCDKLFAREYRARWNKIAHDTEEERKEQCFFMFKTVVEKLGMKLNNYKTPDEFEELLSSLDKGERAKIAA